MLNWPFHKERFFNTVLLYSQTDAEKAVSAAEVTETIKIHYAKIKWEPTSPFNTTVKEKWRHRMVKRFGLPRNYWLSWDLLVTMLVETSLCSYLIGSSLFSCCDHSSAAWLSMMLWPFNIIRSITPQHTCTYTQNCPWVFIYDCHLWKETGWLH